MSGRERFELSAVQFGCHKPRPIDRMHATRRGDSGVKHLTWVYNCGSPSSAELPSIKYVSTAAIGDTRDITSAEGNGDDRNAENGSEDLFVPFIRLSLFAAAV